MMRLLWVVMAIVFLYGITGNADAKITCEKHPIYCQIIKNRTDKKGNIYINKKYAYKLSNVIHKAAIKYKIPSNLYTAILMQESRYSLKARGCHSGLREKYIENTFQCTEKQKNIECKTGSIILIETRICSDFGMSQIYYKTARRYKFDILKLTTDLQYSIEAGARVLSDFKKRYSRKETDWWTRYNASSKVKRRIYKELVERFL